MLMDNPPADRRHVDDLQMMLDDVRYLYLCLCPAGWGVLMVSAWNGQILITRLPSQTLDVKVRLSA